MDSQLETPNAFQQLVQDLSVVLGPTSGFDAAEVDHHEIERIMHGYTSNVSEWKMYALADYSRAYTRNLVDKGNGKSNLLVIVWTPGKGSPIHDHADAHCVMKILKGTLQETLYDWPDGENRAAPVVKKDTFYHENDVAYMSDQLGLHRVQNPHPENVAISLHLYTPPHAANHGCYIFDEKTGKASHVPKLGLYSEAGSKL